ncbi:MAG: transcriptional regulator [Candidatus Micrarchaeia archaeon]
MIEDDVIKEFIPAFKARCAKILYKDYKMNQKDIASMLNITQPAIHKYLKGKYSSKIKKIEKDIEDSSIISFIDNTMKDNKYNAQKYVCKECSKIMHNDCILKIE